SIRAATIPTKRWTTGALRRRAAARSGSAISSCAADALQPARRPSICPPRRNAMADDKHATLYRMVLPDHVCPFGVRARELLLERGYDIDDRVLRTRDEVEAVKDEFGVATTPVIFLG